MLVYMAETTALGTFPEVGSLRYLNETQSQDVRRLAATIHILRMVVITTRTDFPC